MKEIKKGIAPTKEYNTQTHNHFIKGDTICLALMYGGLILFIAGYVKGIGSLWGIGIGLSLAMIIIQAIVDKEDRDDE